MRVPHPIPYQGSKRALADRILSFFPASVSRLVEPFAGSAAVSLAAAYHGVATDFWINDAHRPIVDLWKQIIDFPEQLSEKYALLWHEQLGRERAYYDQVRNQFNCHQKPEHFLYLLARCVKAAIRYNSNGEFNNSPDNRRKGATPENMRKRILGASLLLRNRTQITSLDYRDVLRRCISTDLIYMDPPYQGVCDVRDHRYSPKVNREEFCDALSALNRKGCLYIVSYDGRTGTKCFGTPLPKTLGLKRIEIRVGRSTQATLLGRNAETYESLYLSSVLARGNRRKKKSKRVQMVMTFDS